MWWVHLYSISLPSPFLDLRRSWWALTKLVNDALRKPMRHSLIVPGAPAWQRWDNHWETKDKHFFFFFFCLNRVLSEIPSGNYSLNEMLQLKVHFGQEKCSSYQLELWPGWKLSGDQSHPLETLQAAFGPEWGPLSSPGVKWLCNHLPLSETLSGAPNPQACDPQRIVTDRKNIPPPHTSNPSLWEIPEDFMWIFHQSQGEFWIGAFAHIDFTCVCELIMVWMLMPQIHS